LERFTQRAGHGDLGAGVDLDVIGEPPDHAVELDTLRGFGDDLERERERVGPGPQARRVGHRVAPRGVGALYRILGRPQPA
jgi:hypothetical protein